MGLNALTRDPQGPLALDTARSARYEPKAGSHRKGPFWHLDLGLSASKAVSSNVLFFISSPVSGVLLKKQPKRLRD